MCATTGAGVLGRTVRDRKATLTLRVAGGPDVAFAHDDPQLRHLAYAYASTVHGAQGQTRERVIAVLDSGHGLLSNQQTFYVQLSRARETAVVLTDNREQLVETLEANTGERLTALEAIGEAVECKAPAKAEIVSEAAASFLERLRTGREREAAVAATRSKADLVEAWLEDAAKALGDRRFTGPSPADEAVERGFTDGYEYEEWHLGLEGLVARGRTAVREAVESGAVDEGAAARVEASRERLERVLAREKARIARHTASEQAREWLSNWGAPPIPRTRSGPVRETRWSRTDAGSPLTRRSRTSSDATSKKSWTATAPARRPSTPPGRGFGPGNGSSGRSRTRTPPGTRRMRPDGSSADARSSMPRDSPNGTGPGSLPSSGDSTSGAPNQGRKNGGGSRRQRTSSWPRSGAKPPAPRPGGPPPMPFASLRTFAVSSIGAHGTVTASRQRSRGSVSFRKAPAASRRTFPGPKPRVSPNRFGTPAGDFPRGPLESAP